MKKLLLFLILIIMGGGCASIAQNTPNSQHQIPAQESQFVAIANGETFLLEANQVSHSIAGGSFDFFGYNNQIPGPILFVKQDDTITVDFVNNLGEDTALHSHGIRMDNAFDGVPGVTQSVVPDGGSFEYQLRFDDPGLYWYHPHVREDKQQELGLAGLIWVEPKDNEYYPEVDQTEFLVLDDILVDRSGDIEFDDTLISHTVMGRYGNVVLTNGDDLPEQYRVQIGSRVRFGMLNAANARPFNIGIDKHQMKLVSADNGRVEREEMIDTVIISPSERYIVDVLFDQVGLYNIYHETPDKKIAVASVLVEGENSDIESIQNIFLDLRSHSDIRSEIDDFDSYLLKNADKEIRLSIDMPQMEMMMNMPCHQMPDGSMMGNCEDDTDVHVDPIEWEDDMSMMNSMSTDQSVTWEIIDEETGAINEDIDWTFEKGDYVKVRIYNDETSMHPMQHPIHFHGQRFFVLSTNGIANENVSWQDTTLVQTGDTVDILVEMSNPGSWVAHCHIAEHMHSGMMFTFNVK